MVSFKMEGGGAVPTVIAAAIAGFSVAAIFHLLIGKYDTTLVLITGSVLATIFGHYSWKSATLNNRNNPPKSYKVDIFVISGIVLWALFNLFFTSQHLLTNRDPATYNLAGQWLTNHETLKIDKPTELTQINNPNLTAESLGFPTSIEDQSQLEAQGTHIIPALAAIPGKLFGIEAIIKLNVLFGATALFAFYGFSKLLVKPRWAALGTLILGLSLPMLFMSRDTYTEPLMMTFIFGGLSLLYFAQKSKEGWQWLLAGLVLGATALTRIDAYIIFIAIILFTSTNLIFAKKRDRQPLLICGLWLLIGMGATAYLGWLDVSQLSSAYYHAHRKYIFPEFLLSCVLVMVGLSAALINWSFNYTEKLNKVTKRWRQNFIYVVVPFIFLILASRPLWMTGYSLNDAGTPVRTFSEQTLNWVIWYIGPITAVAAVAGFAYIIAQLFDGKANKLLPLTLLLLTTASLYLLHPSITGDQVWATRRLLPVVIPSMIIFAIVVYQQLFELKKYKWRGNRINTEILAAVLVTISVLSPLFVTYPFLLRRLYVPQLSQIHTVCNSIPKNSLVIWAGESSKFAVQPTRTLCGNPTLGLPDVSNPQFTSTALQQLREWSIANSRPIVIGWYAKDNNKLAISKTSAPKSSITYYEIEHTYKRPPRNVITLHNDIFLVTINANDTP